jgi:hypothetical protein
LIHELPVTKSSEKTKRSRPREIDICGTEKKDDQSVKRTGIVEHIFQDLDGSAGNSESGKAPAITIAIANIYSTIHQKIVKARRAICLNDLTKKILNFVDGKVVRVSWIPALGVVTFLVRHKFDITQFTAKEVLRLAARNILLNVLV